ncbi:hypothetical protein VPNG_05867 [Cytospora leucostoma]|uniref:DUF4470 domain-containing protein n=1 Tax=Cytospora leucostoma TaxID=1230097 RepID=A0A423X0F2_9PEZI|nr:hypothetical protein VPNG_05867 [Cytospora leucostoma]
MPAFDIINLQANEGEGYDKPLSFLFAASGDLRNVVKTIASLPEGFSSGLKVDINDLDMDIVARNIIFLLLFYTLEDGEEAAECVLHLWYSTLIPPWCLLKLDSLKDLIVRSVVMNAPQRIDHRQRKLFEQLKPSWRMCTNRFRQDGILLPFGHPRTSYTIPNPTFFQSADEWPLKDSSDPMDGWPISEVLDTHTAARDDVNGKLFQYIRSTLAVVHSRLRSLEISFQLFHGDIQRVIQLIDAEPRYDRIEVSNICDKHYLGTQRTLALFGPKLCPQERNPHATLITLFMNAVEQECSRLDSFQDTPHEMQKLSAFLPLAIPLDGHTSDAKFLRFSQAKAMMRDGDKYFNRYMKREDFRGAGEMAGVTMKSRNTVIDEWPLQLKLRPKDKGAKEAFENLLGSGHSGLERYVEWRRSF